MVLRSTVTTYLGFNNVACGVHCRTLNETAQHFASYIYILVYPGERHVNWNTERST